MTRQILLPILGIVLLACAPSTAHGQQLVAGDAIRVRASQSTEPDRQWIDATVARLTPDTLWYQSDDIVSPISIDNAEIRRRTHRDHRWDGLAIGALTGAVVGGLAAYASYEPRFCSDSFLFSSCSGQANSRAGDTAFGAANGVRYGAGLGFLVGMLLGRWETVELDQLTVGDGNLAVSISIRR
jgi:hypothetical protein